MSESENIKGVPSALQFEQGGDDEIEIDLVDLFYMLLGHWWQILLSVLVCVAISLGVTRFLIEPLYEASARIYVVSASSSSLINLSDLQMGSTLAKDYEVLILSRSILENVIDIFELEMDLEELTEAITITNEVNTRILTITVTYNDPEMAADIANEITKEAIIYLPKIMETSTPNLIESAVPPEEKSSPSYMLYVRDNKKL